MSYSVSFSLLGSEKNTYPLPQHMTKITKK